MRRVADPQATPVGSFRCGQGGRLQIGIVAGFISERWPASNRYAWPECVGIRTVSGIRENAELSHHGCDEQMFGGK
jgi:hypothetical protein